MARTSKNRGSRGDKKMGVTVESEVKVLVRRFRRDTIDLGGVSLGVLRLVSENIERRKGDPVDVLYSIIEKIDRGSVDSLVEVTVSDSRSYIIGEVLEEAEGRPRLLFPRPARLIRAGVVRIGALELAGKSSMYVVKGVSAALRSVGRNVYVYEGIVKSDDKDVYLVVLDTEFGRRIIRVAPGAIVSRLVQHVLSRPEQS